MANVFLRHPVHGEKVAISWMEVEEDLQHGWEEFDPSSPDDSESSVSPEMVAPRTSANALRARRRRKE